MNNFLKILILLATCHFPALAFDTFEDVQKEMRDLPAAVENLSSLEASVWKAARVKFMRLVRAFRDNQWEGENPEEVSAARKEFIRQMFRALQGTEAGGGSGRVFAINTINNFLLYDDYAPVPLAHHIAVQNDFLEVEREMRALFVVFTHAGPEQETRSFLYLLHTLFTTVTQNGARRTNPAAEDVAVRMIAMYGAGDLLSMLSDVLLKAVDNETKEIVLRLLSALARNNPEFAALISTDKDIALFIIRTYLAEAANDSGLLVYIRYPAELVLETATREQREAMLRSEVLLQDLALAIRDNGHPIMFSPLRILHIILFGAPIGEDVMPLEVVRNAGVIYSNEALMTYIVGLITGDDISLIESIDALNIVLKLLVALGGENFVSLGLLERLVDNLDGDVQAGGDMYWGLPGNFVDTSRERILAVVRTVGEAALAPLIELRNRHADDEQMLARVELLLLEVVEHLQEQEVRNPQALELAIPRANADLPFAARVLGGSLRRYGFIGAYEAALRNVVYTFAACLHRMSVAYDVEQTRVARAEGHGADAAAAPEVVLERRLAVVPAPRLPPEMLLAILSQLNVRYFLSWMYPHFRKPGR